MTRDLPDMAAWLAAEGVTHVAIESTELFWKPIFNILEGRFTVLLVLRSYRGTRVTFGTPKLEKALEGKLTNHHRFQLKLRWKRTGPASGAGR